MSADILPEFFYGEAELAAQVMRKKPCFNSLECMIQTLSIKLRILILLLRGNIRTRM